MEQMASISIKVLAGTVKNYVDTLEGKKVYIEFNGSNSITDVYVNGHHMGQHRGGYSTFRFDITDVIEFGRQKHDCCKSG